MSTLTAAPAARAVQFARKCAAPLLVLETLGLVGVLASWRLATIAAIGVVLVIGIVSALRRAARQVDGILREEMGSIGAPTSPRITD